ncbi:pantetheine-phosphate adenylyltransferase [bacterium]|nr:pantetheine-phosphate adenylyltransferase [bacterium]NUN44974.1 pantetheine-phosphate adenylyltransferase [bacterium]
MRRAIYPGTFDPLTLGHLDVIARAATLFDEIIVAVANNSKKKPLFSPEERVAMITEATKDIANVRCEPSEGLIVDFAVSRQVHVLIRGLRVISDFEYELQMEHVNRRLNSQIVTMFLMPGEKYAYLNSTIVKEVAQYGGDLSSFVPAFIEQRIKEKLKVQK